MISFVEYSGPKAPPIDIMIVESEREGFAFLRRLIVNWNSGKNRFSSSGEMLLLAIVNKTVVGVGGLNIDPYADDPRIGRIRHVYVANEHRRRGIGRGLIVRLLRAARADFDEVRLRTDTVEGDRFYRALGFTTLPDDTVNSHFVNPEYLGWSENSDGEN